MLERRYTAAVVCAPSRAAFLTGKYTIHSGVRRNDDDLAAEEVTIAEAIKPLGYRTALFGKWHHGKPRVESDNTFTRWIKDSTSSLATPTLYMPGRSFRPSYGKVASKFRYPATSTT